jgi:hypothetical protein
VDIEICKLASEKVLSIELIREEEYENDENEATQGLQVTKFDFRWHGCDDRSIRQ